MINVANGSQAGVMFPLPVPGGTGWQNLGDEGAIKKLRSWGLPSNIYAEKFFTSAKPKEDLIIGEGPEKRSVEKRDVFLSEFDNGTSFMEFGKFFLAPITGYVGAQIYENLFDTDIMSAVEKRSGAERILNTTDRVLEDLIYSKILAPRATEEGRVIENVLEKYTNKLESQLKSYFDTQLNEYIERILPALVEQKIEQTLSSMSYTSSPRRLRFSTGYSPVSRRIYRKG